ncbi:hypothetical protein GUJ93_ZPchr0458g22369 [Zizania palustris]|uniref:NET domain-containing protein n=1 Tax=Zizania palustris TaxID=103762 RepID=A0A8J5VEY1_ZIZPA|nr:hypothetical protein GUJ93_ZPchr0458g22369 [Zizania palustris]
MATQGALTLTMAKAQLIARFAVEAAPPQLSSILRRPRRGVPRMLDTIVEEEAEAAVGTELPTSYALLLRAAAAAAAAAKTPPPRHNVVMTGGGSSARTETKVYADIHRPILRMSIDGQDLSFLPSRADPRIVGSTRHREKKISSPFSSLFPSPPLTGTAAPHAEPSPAPAPAMASALLAGRSGAHHQWGDTRAPLASVPPNSDPSHHSLQRANGSTTARAPPVASQVSVYVSLRPTALAHREALALRDRLAGELVQVRALIARIDTWQQQQLLRQQSQLKDHVSPRRDLPPPQGKLRSAMLKRCEQILAKLRKDKRSIWFNAPVEVDRLGLHDYHTVIKSPMDLGTVKANLAAGRYPSPTPSPPTSGSRSTMRYGTTLPDTRSTPLPERKLLEPPIPVPSELPLATALVQVKPRAGNVKTRKPKAREPNKREMTLEEKNMLRVGLESLPEEKMRNVLQIVRKRNINPELVEGEIELDIDEMDVETQWELDRFVNNFKKALNKSRRAAILNGENADVVNASVANDSDALVNDIVPTMVDNGYVDSKNPDKSTALAEQVDEYVDIGDEMPTATYQSVEIEKDAEVASSGSGSSSSSGSDSGCSRDSISESGNARSLV